MDRAVSYTGFIYMGGRIILICMKFLQILQQKGSLVEAILRMGF